MRKTKNAIAATALWAFLAVCLLCALGTTTEAKADARQNKKPNILFIAIDDLNDWTDMLAGNPTNAFAGIRGHSRRGFSDSALRIAFHLREY